MTTLTKQQQQAVATSQGGGHLIVEALAGTGKTTTMMAMAKARPSTSRLYVSFNRSIVNEAIEKMGQFVECCTVHELAWRNVGAPWVNRVQGPRVDSSVLAARYGLDAVVIDGHRFSAGFLGGLVTRSLRKFSKSADPVPRAWHVPIPWTARDNPDILARFRQLREHVAPLLPQAWADTISYQSKGLPMDGNTIIKMWQLRDPFLAHDLILVDEAQDMNDAARAVLEAQMSHAQLVAVGDTFQQINAWNGAINALAKFPIPTRQWLTTSFRCGPEVAGVANLILRDLGASELMVGGGPPGEIRELGDPDVRLSRTNAEAVKFALDVLQQGRTPHIIGGADDVIKFAESTLMLQAGQPAVHPELACFDTWMDVLTYVANDELGGDLMALVKLMVNFGPQLIIDTFSDQPPEEEADVILSTVHKIKGREWAKVQLAGDFTAIPGDPDVNPEELRLLYVAVTRAQEALDISEVPYFNPGATP